MRLKSAGADEPIVVQTVRELAEHLTPAKSPELAERRLRERVDRLLDLLPDPAICGQAFGVRVSALRAQLVHQGVGNRR